MLEFHRGGTTTNGATPSSILYKKLIKLITYHKANWDKKKKQKTASFAMLKYKSQPKEEPDIKAFYCSLPHCKLISYTISNEKKNCRVAGLWPSYPIGQAIGMDFII